MSGTQMADSPVDVLNPQGAGRVVLVCEHASSFVPASYGNLGLDPAALTCSAAGNAPRRRFTSANTR